MSGGKTGTAQAVGVRANEKYNAAKLEEHKRDHALYMAFAPVEAPTIALAVVVENAGFGADTAAPMSRRVFDYLLLGRTQRRGHGAHPRGQVGRAGRQVARAVERAAARCRRDRGAAGGVPPAQRVAQGIGAAREMNRRTRPAPMNVALRAAIAVAARRAGVHRLRRPAGAGRAAAGRRRAADHVLGRLRPWHALRRPRPQHAAGLLASCSWWRRSRRRS